MTDLDPKGIAYYTKWVDTYLTSTAPIVERARNGRPYIYPPGGKGKPTSATRSSTFAQTLNDKFTIGQWTTVHACMGVARNRELQTHFQMTPGWSAETKEDLIAWAEKAKDLAGANAAANLGTALHDALKAVMQGTATIGSLLDPAIRADVQAVYDFLDANGIVPLVTERFMVCDELKVAGTPDMIAYWPGLGVVIVDYKTGKLADYKYLEHAIQLVVYSISQLVDMNWNRIEVPDLRSDVGVVLSIPAGTARVEPVFYDLTAAHEAIKCALEVRKWRNAGPRLRFDHPPVAVVQPAAPEPVAPTNAEVAEAWADAIGAPRPEPADPMWIDALATRLKALEPAERKRLAALWPSGVPTLKQGGILKEHQSIIEHAIAAFDGDLIVEPLVQHDRVERNEHVIPGERHLHVVQPDNTPDEGPDASDDDIANLKTRVAGLYPASRQVFEDIIREAGDWGGVNLKRKPSIRRWLIADGLVAVCQRHEDRELVDTYIRTATGNPDIGEAVARMTIQQAEHLYQLAQRDWAIIVGDTGDLELRAPDTLFT